MKMKEGNLNLNGDEFSRLEKFIKKSKDFTYAPNESFFIDEDEAVNVYSFDEGLIYLHKASDGVNTARVEGESKQVDKAISLLEKQVEFKNIKKQIKNRNFSFGDILGDIVDCTYGQIYRFFFGED